MGGDEIHARPWLAATTIEQIRRGRQTLGQIGKLQSVAAPKAAHRVPITVIPLGPARRAPPNLIPPRPAIPRLRDELDRREDRILSAGIEKSAALVEAARLTSEDGRQ